MSVDRNLPTLWSFPFTILLIMLIVAAADVLFNLIPLEISHDAWMWAFSTLITTIIASLVAERFAMEKKKALLSMALSAIFTILFYRDISSLLKRTPINSVESAIQNPFIGMAVYASVLTIIPGVMIGVAVGGILGSIHKAPIERWRPKFKISHEPSDPTVSGYERFCGWCGMTVPYESKYCPFCGKEPERRPAPEVKYCRFCGTQIKYRGQFCPECGQEMEMISKPLVFYFR
ncbi:MAG: zinc ribbon domain-containing protein [Candidatus Bathyarchaeota archaeon]|nr:MAG: zinc ribbon domain-containing protein [Candidatus Bathyarchaeota archaeon]